MIPISRSRFGQCLSRVWDSVEISQTNKHSYRKYRFNVHVPKSRPLYLNHGFPPRRPRRSPEAMDQAKAHPPRPGIRAKPRSVLANSIFKFSEGVSEILASWLISSSRCFMGAQSSQGPGPVFHTERLKADCLGWLPHGGREVAVLFSFHVADRWS